MMKLTSVIALLLSASNIALAAPAADLAVVVNPPASELVNTANLYTLVVSNLGNKDAAAVKLEVNLPVTNTSPQKFLMGLLSQLDSRCAVVIGKITCNLGVLKKGKSTNVNFHYSIPVSSASLAINATVSTTTADSNANNNVRQHIPAQVFFSRLVVGPLNVANSHCTGTALSSYFECEKFPSSIAGHAAVFHANGTITFPDAPDAYGYWQQAPNALDRLSFQYLENGEEILNFQGFGSKANCFDGVSHFPQSPNYVSPYRVCL